MNELILFITGLVIGFALSIFLDIWIMREFGCKHDCAAQYNDKKHCMDCGKKIKTMYRQIEIAKIIITVIGTVAITLIIIS